MPLDWEESDPRYISNAADVKLRAFSTKAGAGGSGRRGGRRKGSSAGPTQGWYVLAGTECADPLLARLLLRERCTGPQFARAGGPLACNRCAGAQRGGAGVLQGR